MANFFDKDCSISSLASIDISNRGTHTYIGKASVIDDFVKIKHVGGTGDVILGSRTYINSGTVLYSGNGIKLGDNVMIGPNCSLTPVNHNFMDKNLPMIDQGFMKSRGGITVEDDVWISSNVVILDGSYIEKGAVIGANSLVNSRIEAYSINVGSPCKCVGYRK